MITYINKRKKPLPLSATQRSRKRRERLKKRGITELRVEVGFVERELFKRTATAAGFDTVSEYLVSITIEHAETFGIRCKDINAETGK